MATDRKLIVTENMTVDGVIDATEGWFSAAGADEGDDSADLVATLRKHMKAQDGLVLGRVTFESFREYWPKQKDAQKRVQSLGVSSNDPSATADDFTAELYRDGSLVATSHPYFDGGMGLSYYPQTDDGPHDWTIHVTGGHTGFYGINYYTFS